MNKYDDNCPEYLSMLNHKSRVMILAAKITEVGRQWRNDYISRERMEKEISRLVDLLRACHKEHEIAEAEAELVEEIKEQENRLLNNG